MAAANPHACGPYGRLHRLHGCPGAQKSDPVPAKKMRILDPDTVAHNEVKISVCSRSLLSNLSTYSKSP